MRLPRGIGRAGTTVCTSDTDRAGPTRSGMIAAGSSQVFVTSSHGGGRTFVEVIALPVFGVSNVAMAAGTGSIAYLAASSNEGDAFVRAEDGGRLWSPPRRLVAKPEGFSMLFSTSHKVLQARWINGGSYQFLQNANDDSVSSLRRLEASASIRGLSKIPAAATFGPFPLLERNCVRPMVESNGFSRGS